MAGLTRNGFIPETLKAIKSRIEQAISQVNTGFDFDSESPDGQLIGIFSAEVELLWRELEAVYHTYDPDVAEGEALKNLGQLSGLSFELATRSSGFIQVTGDIGTLIPEGSIVSTLDGYAFYTIDPVVIGAGITSVGVLASIQGTVPFNINTIQNIDTVIVGWNTVQNDTVGIVGKDAVDEELYRNLRNRTVLRNTSSLEESLIARLTEFEVEQVSLKVDSTNTATSGLYITVGETTKTDLEIAEQIYKYKGLGVVTHGNIPIQITDVLGNNHIVNFTKAVPAVIEVDLTIKFHSDDVVGAIENMKQALLLHINNLLVGEDVIWSRLFGLITPHGEAEVVSLELSFGQGFLASNINIDDNEFATLIADNINIQVTI